MDGDYLSQSSYQTAVYLRIASLTIALHDYLETIPNTLRYTQEQWKSPRMTISFVLFLFIQFTSIATLVLSNVGYFYTHFTEHSCSHYYLIPSIFKVIQSTVSQTILGFRAFNLSRRSRMIGISLLALSIATTALEGLTNLYHRTPVIDPQYGNCRGVFQIEHTGFGEWIYYVVAIIYDLATSTVCMIYLHNYKTASNSFFAKVTRMMFYDGIGYFTALTCVNITNLIIYRASQDTQTAAASLGYCMTWIMSKRLIIHLHEVSVQRRNDDTVADSEITSDEQTASSEFRTDEIAETQAKAVRTAAASLELTIPDFDLDDVDGGDDWSENGSIQRVRVEKTVQIERRPRNVYEFEDDMGYNRV
ncbi:hypothetical protein F5878DRAFT_607802 [Lentinula raphanica]|uniref:Uncharacterized protein n=1 Tax=Lentinula raphanica TaxID=153919 RepID=A0AA38PGB7_9AGAR|nr:hypothetical protein F5880DRAFT_356247 [Lentinula raphanica]KAJ3842374.1 hypothetical protein F5878DRAFT_607802 [Lentinula raphanica]